MLGLILAAQAVNLALLVLALRRWGPGPDRSVIEPSYPRHRFIGPDLHDGCQRAGCGLPWELHPDRPPRPGG